jgi:hypothetical protein
VTLQTKLFYLSLIHAVSLINFSVEQLFIYLLLLIYLHCFCMTKTIMQHFLIKSDIDHLAIKKKHSNYRRWLSSRL